MHSKKSVLKNGLTVISVDTGSFPTCTALLMIGTGSRYETKQNNGIAHFFEHMAFKGSRRFPTALDLSTIVEGFGGVFNAFTSKEYTGYWIKGPVSHAGTMVDVLADMIQHPILNPEELEKEKGVIVEEINMYEDTPQSKVGDLYEQLIFAGSPLGMDVIGTKKTVTSATRKTFTDFIDAQYHPENAVLIVAGGIGKFSPDETLFEQWIRRDRPTCLPFSPKDDAHEKIQRKKTAEQSHLMTGFRTFGIKDEKKHVLSVLSAVLGGGMSSRLFQELREKRGLCYYVGASRELYLDTGTFYVRAGVPVNEEKITETKKVIAEEEQKLVTRQVPNDEIIRAKELLKGHFLLSLEDSFDVAYLFGRKHIIEGEMANPDVVVKKIDAVTAEEVQQLAKEIFSTPRFTALVTGE